MAQAAALTTAIRQLMSRGPAQKSTGPVRQAHTERIAVYAPANADDLEGCADHLEKVFGALHAYLVVVTGDTAQNIPGGALDAPSLNNRFRDLSSEAVGIIRAAATEMRQDENRRAP